MKLWAADGKPIRFKITEPDRHKSLLHIYPVFLFSCGTEITDGEICSNLPADHCIFQEPGLPFRIFSSSTFHRGKPTPGKSSNSLGKEVMFQRDTEAIVFRFSES